MSPEGDPPEELEVKFLTDDPRAARRWIDTMFPPSDGARWQSFTIVDRYFDTADGRLASAGYGARLRRANGLTVLTVKADLEVDGARHRRVELESPATRALDWRRWPDSEAKTRVAAVAGDDVLVESFVVRGRRREREVAIEGACVSASIDDAVVEWCGARAGELRQVEFEMRGDGPDVLDRIAALAPTDLLRPEPRSKLAMAAAMAEAASAISLDDALAEAGRKYLRRQLLRMLEREGALRHGDPEALRQMRVATRRMRAGWRVFGDPFRKRERRRYITELRRVARALGEVRDLDVLLSRLPADAALGAMRHDWLAERARAWQHAEQMLNSRDQRRFVRDYLALTGRSGAGVARRRAGLTVAAALPGLVDDAVSRLLRAEEAARGTSDDETWHEMRIRAKRLRYTLEAFGEVLDERAATATIEALRRLQDVLGEMNDAAVAARAAATWASGNADAPPATLSAVTRFVEECRAATSGARSRFAAVWGSAETTFSAIQLTER